MDVCRFSRFVVYLGVQWWAFWYPGAEPGGGGYIAQRIFSARDERNGLLSVLWFNIAHYAVRPWPWILTALAAMVLYPGLEHPETGYMLVVNQHVPPALRGIVIAGFHGGVHVHHRHPAELGRVVSGFGFLSSLSSSATPTNTTTFMSSRLATVLLVIAAALFPRNWSIIRSGWQFVLEVGAGTGGVYLLRWYWWRINAWSEISAMATALVVTLWLRWTEPFTGPEPVVFAKTALTTTAVTTLVWLAGDLPDEGRAGGDPAEVLP